MRHLISGLVAAVAVMAAAPAMACGYTSCGYSAPQVYVAPIAAYTSSGCNPCGGVGWGYEQLADPEQQYYYVNQGPTYSGPGAWAPARVYEEDTVVGYRPYYGYGFRSGVVAPRAYGYRYGYRSGFRYGYGARYGYAGRYGYGARYGYRGARFGRY